ncbi:hypothetical protein THAOC_12660 [Thalassiosira oceanica]|uniref:JmjC domain-containing protein n=1 Tax=Thalassiosira oceanica TaxID=159749 RepID=K0T7G5_THAOC|nr:hypothetical protein THAOC_12660 [Thalassiosira oceanica]|eukprot:EJK66427.1 hypothetical protein THAOC_12660 [Thalassiosira oceanica]
MKEDTSAASLTHLSTDNDEPHSAPTEIGRTSLEESLHEHFAKPPSSAAEEHVITDPITIVPAAKGEAEMESSEADFQIQCDIPTCGSWYHSHELDPPLTSKTASQYKTWHCPQCVPYHGPSVQHARRNGLRKRKHIDFVKLNDPSSILENEGSSIGAAESDVQDADFDGMLRSRQNKGMFTSGSDKRKGCLLQLAKHEDFNADYVSSHGFDKPVLFKKTPGALGLKVPRSKGGDFGVSTVAKLVGPYRKVQVIDSATQLTTEYTMAEYAEYINTPRSERKRILNVITLEFSDTPLGDLVTEPSFPREVDFVRHWPQNLDELRRKLATSKMQCAETQTEEEWEMELQDMTDELDSIRPRVSKYCLMSASGSYTDYHIDFGGTAVWYHVHTGAKIFYFIEPTKDNLNIFATWATSAFSHSARKEMLCDRITQAGGKVYQVTLKAGETLFIPSGWIHAVYTPMDSLVFGGNFIHEHSLEMQLRIYKLEIRMRVDKKFKFPCYQMLLWFVGQDFLLACEALEGAEGTRGDLSTTDRKFLDTICRTYSSNVLRGYKALAKELVRWSKSKLSSFTEQFPRNMDVDAVSRRLCELMSDCLDYLDATVFI